MHKLVTIVITSYRSRELILSHIKILNKNIKNVKIIIVENSRDKILQKIIQKKYKNVQIFLQKNIGFGSAINYGAKFVKTKYFFIMNPDTKIYKNTINNLLLSAKKIKIFGGLSPEHNNIKKKNTSKKIIIEKKKITAAAILFQTKIFKKIKGFDENIFLYYEENDFFKRCNLLNLKLYVVKNSFYHHSLKGDSSSAIFNNINEKFYDNLMGGWHGQWSKFYYLKKYNGYAYSFLKCLPNLLVNILQLILNIFIRPKKAKYIYYKIEGLICSMISLKSFKRSKFDKF